MRQLSAEECEAKLDELLDTLVEDGPISVTLNGTEAAVMITPEHYAELLSRRPGNDGLAHQPL